MAGLINERMVGDGVIGYLESSIRKELQDKLYPVVQAEVDKVIDQVIKNLNLKTEARRDILTATNKVAVQYQIDLPDSISGC